MKLNKGLFIVFELICLSIVKAQKPIFYLNFDNANINEKITHRDSAVYVNDLQRSQYAQGISGRDLDLSANAILRRPIKLEKGTLPALNEKASFSIQVWVKTIPDAIMGTPIMGNKKVNDLTTAGWQIYTQENGAWALILNDGKRRYDYKPTAQRQRINDGKWHQIIFTVDRKKQEVWMYLDGRNTAIYNTPDLGDLSTKLSTVIGGSDEKWEYSTQAQWYAFNGYIDEVKVWNTAITSAEVQNLYTQFFSNTNINKESYDPKQLRVLSWNIMNSGKEYGEAVGLQRVIETIKSTHADIVGLIETYGSGAVIADSLGYYFYLISSNLSIMSRFPITETIKEFQPANFGGAKLKLGPNKELIYFDTWLDYLPDVDAEINQKHENAHELILNEGPTRYSEMKKILKLINPYLKNTGDLPIIMGGDFNSGSHLDWTAETKAIHYNLIFEWPESKAMLNAGFTDSYRLLHINPLLYPGITWGVRAATTTGLYGYVDRIDFIYYKGKDVNPIQSKVIDYNPVMFPSDHAAVMTVFQLN